MSSFHHDPFRPTNLRSEDAQTSPIAEDQATVSVPDGTTKEVLSWVGDDPSKARAALDKEMQHNSPRKGLVNELNSLVADEDQ